MNKITNKRYKLFIENLGYSEEQYLNLTENKKTLYQFNFKYICFTNSMEEKYLKEKQLSRIYDFVDFDNYCINYLKAEVSK